MGIFEDWENKKSQAMLTWLLREAFQKNCLPVCQFTG
jgi:hypothetical protein